MEREDWQRFKWLVLLTLLTLILHFAERAWPGNKLVLALYIFLYILAGKEVIRLAFLGIKNKQPLDEHFLMTLATLAAFFVGQYPESIYVLVFYNFGELFEDVATNKSRKDIKDLIDIVPEKATRIKDDGSLEEVDLDEVEVGDILLIKDGEKVGVDGRVVEGRGLLDTSSLTGESLPQEVEVGDEVLSSSILTQGPVKIRAEKEFDDSIAAKIIELIEEGVDNKSKSEKFITRFSRIYTPIVVGLAIGLALIPPLFLGGDRSDYIFRAATFLVVSCPCALVLSIPLTFISGLGLSSKHGILIKGSEYIENLVKSQVLLTDKTGTLTKGNFKIKDIKIEEGFDRDEILKIVYNAELNSTHPLAKAIVEGLSYEKDEGLLASYENKPGLGLLARTSDGREVKIGNAKFLGLEGDLPQKSVLIALDGVFAGEIDLEDEIKEGSRETIEDLKKDFKEIAILSGDSEKSVADTAEELGLSSYYAGLLPQEKLELLKKYEDQGAVFVGDGINDGPILKNAGVGISMGEAASDIAIEASDILVVDGEFKSLSTLMKIANLTMKTVRQNVNFIIFVKVLVLILGFIGKTNMWVAILGDVGVSIIAILWGMRIQYKKI